MFVTFLHSFFLAIFRLSFGMRSVLQSWCPLMCFLLFSIPFSPQVAVAAYLCEAIGSRSGVAADAPPPPAEAGTKPFPQNQI